MILFDTVTKKYPRTTRPAVDGVSLEVERGEFVFIVGQSGSGKSTLLRLALKEENATSGSVFVAGRELSRLPDRKVPQLRREIGTVFQDFRLLPNKTVFQNVAFALQVIGKSGSVIRQTVPETLRIVGLEGKEKRLPHELSGGEQQRVAIARALVNNPSILLADEPTGNLDPGISLEIAGLLDRVNRSGTTSVMATHDLHIVNAYRTRVIELREDPSRPLVIHGVQKILHPPVQLPSWPDGQRGTRLVLITLDPPDDYIRRLFAAFTNRSSIDTPDHAALESNPLAIAGR